MRSKGPASGREGAKVGEDAFALTRVRRFDAHAGPALFRQWREARSCFRRSWPFLKRGFASEACESTSAVQVNAVISKSHNLKIDKDLLFLPQAALQLFVQRAMFPKHCMSSTEKEERSG